MTEHESVVERLTEIKTTAVSLTEPQTKTLRWIDYEWLCNQLEWLARRERVLQLELLVAKEECGDYLKTCDERDQLRETVKRLETEITRLKSKRYGLYEDVCGERDRLREQLATISQTETTVEQAIEQAVAAEQQRCAGISQQCCTRYYRTGRICGVCVICSAVETIRRPPKEAK